MNYKPNADSDMAGSGNTGPSEALVSSALEHNVTQIYNRGGHGKTAVLRDVAILMLS